jgi:hypothetical protein
MLENITKGISEIMDKKDPATGSSGGLLTGITKGINEALDSVLGDIPTFGAPKNEYAPLPPTQGDAGIAEYGLYRDLATAGNTSFLDSYAEQLKTGNFLNMGPAIAAAATSIANGRIPWDTIIKEADVRMNTVLEERSYIDVYFPNQNIGRRRIAFFENPKIREDRTARYASTNIVARNEPVRLYTGSDARKVKLEFVYTLPHIEYFLKLCNQQALAGFVESATNSIALIGAADAPISTTKNAYANFVKNKLGKFFGNSFKTSFSNTVQISNSDRKTGPRFYEPTFQEPKDGIRERKTSTHLERLVRAWTLDSQQLTQSMGMMAVYYTQFVIDTVRAAVVGDTVKETNAVGPPIVRFRHGTVFNEAPFIIKSYNIEYADNKGYEVKTLMPRQVRVSLNLEEFRQTHGSHHGDINTIVPDATQILELNLDNLFIPQMERQVYPKK